MNKPNIEFREKILDLQEKILENQSKLYDYAIKDHGPMSFFTGIVDFLKKLFHKCDFIQLNKK